MASATDESVTKRTRFGPVEIIDNGRPTAPLSSAESYIKNHLASLHPNLALILEKLAFDNLRLQAKLFHKIKQVDRMKTNVDVIPRSARVDFTFSVSAQAEKSLVFIDDFHQTCRR